MRVLVLGSTGFLGRLLTDELTRAGHAVEGWSRSAPDHPRSGTRRVDLVLDDKLPAPRDPWDAAVLAAGASVPARFVHPEDAATTQHLARRTFAHIALHAPGTRCVVVSSAHVFAPSSTPLHEDATLAPQGPYGLTKLAVEREARSGVHALDVVVARLFGSLGPGQPAGLFVPDLLRRLAGGAAHIELAGPDALRDLTDGRDVARALRLLVETPRAAGGTFHVGSGTGTRLSDLAARIARASGRDFTFQFAPGDASSWIADPSRLRAVTGWTPRHDLDATVAWLLRETNGGSPPDGDPPGPGALAPRERS